LTQARADATAKQPDAQQALKRERDNALDEVAALKGTVEELTQAREHAEARTVELSQRLRKVRQSKAQEIAGSIGAAYQLPATPGSYANSSGSKTRSSARQRPLQTLKQDCRLRKLTNSVRRERQQTLTQSAGLQKPNNSGSKTR